MTSINIQKKPPIMRQWQKEGGVGGQSTAEEMKQQEELGGRWFQIKDKRGLFQIFEAMEVMIKDDDNYDGGEGKMFEDWFTPFLEKISMYLKRLHLYFQGGN